MPYYFSILVFGNKGIYVTCFNQTKLHNALCLFIRLWKFIGYRYTVILGIQIRIIKV